MNVTKLHFSAILVAIAAIFTFGCDTNKPVIMPDYEVLAVPQSAEIFKAGLKWNKTAKAPLADDAALPTSTGKGASSFTSTEKEKIEGGITASFRQWISGKLGLSSSDSVSVTLGDLSHTAVSKMGGIKASSAYLWETVEVSSFEFTVDEQRSPSISVDFSGSQLAKDLELVVKANASSSSSKNYKVIAKQPVVAAIRIISAEVHVRPESMTFDLRDIAVGRQQPSSTSRNTAGPFGYSLILQEKADVLARSAKVRIENPTLGQSKGVVWTFVQNEPWVSEDRQIIMDVKIDPDTADYDYVWDRISLVWASDLATSQANFIRQYLRLVPIKSGLKTR